MKKTAIIFALALLVSSAVAQDAPKAINAGILNGKAISLPMPKYPPGAREAGISGIIAVDVVIDELGNVISAVADVNDQRERRDADGNKLDPVPADPRLREYAEAAALVAKFSPTLIKGSPGKVSGRIMYNFFADEGISRVVESGSISPPYPEGAAGVLNGRALSLPKPEYPVAAKAVRATGSVSVRVMIDEQGNVISAAAVSGHPLLRTAAEQAARLATFSPCMSSEVPVKVLGILTYNFVLPKVQDK